jgi:4-azaleucine resistance transporter AzlC
MRVGAADTIAAGFRDAIPLAVAVGAFGISYGVLARAAGMGVIAPLVMSLTTFGGSAQFAAAGVLGAGGSAAAAILAAVLLNARYGPIGLTIAPSLRGSVFKRFAQAQMVVDESWAVASRGDGTFDRARLVGAGLAIYVFWFAGTALGVLGGDFIGDPKSLGLDAALSALFLALLVGQLRSRRTIVSAVIGGTVALVLIPFAQPGVPIVAAVVGCLAGWQGSGTERVSPRVDGPPDESS